MNAGVSISQITTVSQAFSDDLDAYRAAGADGIGIWEMKLSDDSLERFHASGLAATNAVPAVPSIRSSWSSATSHRTASSAAPISSQRSRRRSRGAQS